MAKVDISDFTDFLYECIETIYENDINLIYNKTKVLNNFYNMVETFVNISNDETDNLWYNLYLHDEKLFIKTFLHDIYSYNWLNNKYINHDMICKLSPNVQKVFLWSIQRNNFSDELKNSTFAISYIKTFDDFVDLINVLLDILTDKEQEVTMFDNSIYESVTNDMCNEIDRIRKEENDYDILLHNMAKEELELFENDIEQYFKKYHMSKLDIYNEIEYCKTEMDSSDVKNRISFLENKLKYVNGNNHINVRKDLETTIYKYQKIINTTPFV